MQTTWRSRAARSAAPVRWEGILASRGAGQRAASGMQDAAQRHGRRTCTSQTRAATRSGRTLPIPSRCTPARAGHFRSANPCKDALWDHVDRANPCKHGRTRHVAHPKSVLTRTWDALFHPKSALMRPWDVLLRHLRGIFFAAGLLTAHIGQIGLRLFALVATRRTAELGAGPALLLQQERRTTVRAWLFHRTIP